MNEKTQTEMTQMRKMYIKQPVIERMGNEVQRLTESVQEFLCYALKVNDKYFHATSFEEKTKRSMENANVIYSEIEKSFNNIFTTAVPLHTCLNSSSCAKLNESEKEFICQQKILLDKFREIYNSLHEYINLERDNFISLRKIEMYEESSKNQAFASPNEQPPNQSPLRYEMEVSNYNSNLPKIDGLFIEINEKIRELCYITSVYSQAFLRFSIEYLNNDFTICIEMPCDERKIYSKENLK
jgi:hypothetical protein